MIKNPEIITHLIKEGCLINLQRLKDIDLIISANNIKTAEEYQQAMNYIKWHAEKTNKQVMSWDPDVSFNMYIEYLTKRNEYLGELNLEPQPKEDIYEILQEIYKIEDQITNKYKRIMRKKIIKKIEEEKKKLREKWWENH